MTATRARLIGVLAAAAVAVSLGALGAGPASAHSQLTGTTPENGAILDSPPPEVRLTFDAPLLDDTDTISINDMNGNVVSSVHPKVEGNSVAIAWPAGTKPGSYQIAYRVVCGDGHPVVGAMNITVNSAGPAVAAGAADPTVAAPDAAPASAAAVVAADGTTPPGDGGAGSALPLIAGGAILMVAALALVGALVMRRRETPTVTTP